MLLGVVGDVDDEEVVGNAVCTPSSNLGKLVHKCAAVHATELTHTPHSQTIARMVQTPA